jgi:hypothetical protein
MVGLVVPPVVGVDEESEVPVSGILSSVNFVGLTSEDEVDVMDGHIGRDREDAVSVIQSFLRDFIPRVRHWQIWWEIPGCALYRRSTLSGACVQFCAADLEWHHSLSAVTADFQRYANGLAAMDGLLEVPGDRTALCNYESLAIVCSIVVLLHLELRILIDILVELGAFFPVSHHRMLDLASPCKIASVHQRLTFLVRSYPSWFGADIP